MWSLLLLACRAPEGAELTGQILLADLHGSQWLQRDLETDAVTGLSLSSLEPEVCGTRQSGVYCLTFQARRRLAWDGALEVVFTYSALDARDGSDAEREDLIGRVAGTALDGAPRWSFSALDFSALPDGQAECRYDPLDPCAPPDSLTDPQYQDCRLRMPHDLVITEEDQDSLTMWVADSNNSRLLKLRAPRDGDCAVVEEVLGPRHADWVLEESVNSLQYWEEAGVPTLLFSSKGSSRRAEAGRAQGAGEGRGKIFLWQEGATGWAERWQFPSASTEAPRFVNTPHGVETWVGADGQRRVAFAQSLGRSDTWAAGFGGSVTVLSLIDGQPVYQMDLVPEGHPLGFPRDVFPLDADTLLVADSGCLSSDCDRPTRVWLLDVAGLAGDGGDGVWSADHSQQSFVAAPVLAELAPDALTRAYSVEWWPAAAE